MADHPDVLFLRDYVELGRGWRPRRMVRSVVGSDRWSCDVAVALGLGSDLDGGARFVLSTILHIIPI
jgi:hypothetical protein